MGSIRALLISALWTLLGMLGGQRVLWLQGWQRIERGLLLFEHVLGTLDGDLGCARCIGCDVQFVVVIPWLDSEQS